MAAPALDVLIIRGQAMGRYGLDWPLEKFWQELSADSMTGRYAGPRETTISVHAWESMGFLVEIRPDLNGRTVGIVI